MSNSTLDREEQNGTAPRGGDPLAAMYVIAAFVMGVAAIVIVALIFIPTEWFEEDPAEGVFVPGQGPGWTPPATLAALSEPPGLREVGPGRYVAVLQAFNWEFVPREIRIPVGSEVTFRARSSQEYHGFAIIDTPIIMSLAQNEVREATHTFDRPGEYLFVCSEYCGGGHVAMMGKVIVE